MISCLTDIESIKVCLTLFLSGMIVFYVRQKFNETDHKIQHMLGIVQQINANNMSMPQEVRMGGGGGSMPPNVNEGPPPPPVETKLPERSARSQNLPNRPDLMSARGVSINDNERYADNEERISRPEMRGPSSKQSEINSLLSGLKTKQINVDNKELSTISIDDLKDLTNVKVPKSKRKQKSDKNIVSLDI